MIELPAELERMPPACPGRVTLVLGIVDLTVLGQIRGQPEAGIRVGGVGKPDVRGTRGYVFDGALGEGLATRKLEKALAVAHASLRYEIGRPSVSIVPTILPVLRRHSHKRAASDGGG